MPRIRTKAWGPLHRATSGRMTRATLNAPSRPINSQSPKDTGSQPFAHIWDLSHGWHERPEAVWPQSSQGTNPLSNPLYSLQTRNIHFRPPHPDLRQPGAVGLRMGLGVSLRTPWPRPLARRWHCSSSVNWLGPAAPASGSAAGPGWPRWGAGVQAARGPRHRSCGRWSRSCLLCLPLTACTQGRSAGRPGRTRDQCTCSGRCGSRAGS